MRRIEEILSGSSNTLGSVLARAGLWCLCQPYAAAMWGRNIAYDRGWKKTSKAAAPVISVGNLTAGGTGKSPTVALLARWFRQREMRVAILSRGYGAGLDGRNDEAKELEVLLPDVPHLQDPDRLASANIATGELGMEVLLLDDGFQHRRIHRDLEIVLLDAREPFGFGHLLPRGLLREPLRSLRRAHLVMATRADQVDPQKLADIRTRVQRYNPKAAWLEAEHAPTRLRNSDGETLPIDWLRSKNILAFCGLGNPQGFHQTLRALDANVVESVSFADHHLYTANDIYELESKANVAHSKIEALVCTGKDLAKIESAQIGPYPLWSLDVELKVRIGAEVLDEYLGRVVRAVEERSVSIDNSAER
jgi:tetraacyldisaccharide 4'-kinase